MLQLAGRWCQQHTHEVTPCTKGPLCHQQHLAPETPGLGGKRLGKGLWDLGFLGLAGGERGRMPGQKLKAWGGARCDSQVFVHTKPLFPQEHHPKQAQAFQGWLVPCFMVF